MLINFKKFINTHLSLIIILIYNFIMLFLFAFLYFLCEFYDKGSFNNTNKSTNLETTIFDHFLLSCAIQSTVGFTSITPMTNKAKLIVFIQQIIVMMSALLAIYLFIFLKKI